MLVDNSNSPLASSMFAPGIPELMHEFKSTNVQLASFVVSVYVLGFAFGIPHLSISLLHIPSFTNFP
jgi:hypothetical protein